MVLVLEMESIFGIVLRSVDSGGICSGRASGVSPEMYVDGTEPIPRCSRAPRKLSSPPEWSLFTCTSTRCLLMVGMRREGTKQGGWERAGCGWEAEFSTGVYKVNRQDKTRLG